MYLTGTISYRVNNTARGIVVTGVFCHGYRFVLVSAHSAIVCLTQRVATRTEAPSQPGPEGSDYYRDRTALSCSPSVVLHGVLEQRLIPPLICERQKELEAMYTHQQNTSVV